jgi:hypothetical protein
VFKALCKKADKGNESCLPEVRRWLDAEPELVEANGSPAEFFRRELFKAYGHNVILQEALRRKLDKIQRDLEGPDPTPLIRLLAERAALCWFQVHRYELVNETAREMTFRQAEFNQRKIEAAHRRFISALKTLATVRKLNLPALQINVAQN